MALKTNELYAESSPRSLPKYNSTLTVPKNFGPDAGTPTLAPLTPVAFNTATNKWVVWTNGGANGTGTISGFLIGSDYGVDPREGITLDAADDTIGNVMMRGEIDYNSIVLPSGELEANLKTALRSGPRALGLDILNLDQVR